MDLYVKSPTGEVVCLKQTYNRDYLVMPFHTFLRILKKIYRRATNEV